MFWTFLFSFNFFFFYCKKGIIEKKKILLKSVIFSFFVHSTCWLVKEPFALINNWIFRFSQKTWARKIPLRCLHDCWVSESWVTLLLNHVHEDEFALALMCCKLSRVINFNGRLQSGRAEKREKSLRCAII